MAPYPLHATGVAYGEKKARTLSGAEVWVVPNPRGLNAHETVDSLADAYRAAAEAAGLCGVRAP